MTGGCNKTLFGFGLIILLAAGMNPQTPSPAASNQPAQAASAPAVPAQAQNRDKEQKPAPVYESATVLKSVTRLVVLDVVATDKDGAITNLKPDDFSILEDGKEQKIRVFNLHSRTRIRLEPWLLPQPSLRKTFSATQPALAPGIRSTSCCWTR